MIKKHVPPTSTPIIYPTFDDLPPLPSPPDQEKKDKIISELRHKGEQMLVCATQRRASALREWGDTLKEFLSMQQAITAMKASINDLELAQAHLISSLSRGAADIAFGEWVVVGNQAHRLVSQGNGDMLSSLPLTTIPEPTKIEEECLDLEKEYM